MKGILGLRFIAVAFANAPLLIAPMGNLEIIRLICSICVTLFSVAAGGRRSLISPEDEESLNTLVCQRYSALTSSVSILHIVNNLCSAGDDE